MITRRQFVMRGGLLVPAAGLLTSNVRAANYLPNRRQAFRGAPVLDPYSSGVLALFSTRRRLLTSYTGALIRVQRSSDNTESDIGYASDGSLDQSALTAFTGAGSGYIAKIYDQSGNGWHATQATYAAMPRIVLTGTVDTQDGYPCARFDGIDDKLVTAAGLASARPWTAFQRYRFRVSSSARTMAGFTNNWLLGGWGGYVDRAYASTNWAYQGTTVDTASSHLMSWAAPSSGNNSISYDRTIVATTSVATAPGNPNGLVIGSGGAGGLLEWSQSNITETMLWNTALSDSVVAEIGLLI